MGIADILDETVELYKTSFALLVGIAAFVYVPYAILERYVLAQQVLTVAAKTSSMSGPRMSDLMLMLGTLVVACCYLLATAPLLTGALTYAISERFLDRRVGILDSFRRVLSASVFFKLLLVIVIKAVVLAAPLALIVFALFFIGLSAAGGHVGMGIVLVLVALGLAGGLTAFLLLLRLALVEVSIVVEGHGIGHALTRTWVMMRGNMIKCFVLYLIAWIVTGVVTWLCTSPTEGVIMAGAATGGHAPQAVLILHTLIGAISSTVLAPVLSIVTILLYYDIRIRKEGFDLELLASELDAKTAAWSGPELPQEQPAPPDSSAGA